MSGLNQDIRGKHAWNFCHLNAFTYVDCLGGKTNDKGIFFKISLARDIHRATYSGTSLGDEYRGLSSSKNPLSSIFCQFISQNVSHEHAISSEPIWIAFDLGDYLVTLNWQFICLTIRKVNCAPHIWSNSGPLLTWCQLTECSCTSLANALPIKLLLIFYSRHVLSHSIVFSKTKKKKKVCNKGLIIEA